MWPFYFFYYYFQAEKIRSENINLVYLLFGKIWAIIELQVGHAKLAPTVKLVPSFFTFLSQASYSNLATNVKFELGNPRFH
jgi:hypothetical protein